MGSIAYEVYVTDEEVKAASLHWSPGLFSTERPRTAIVENSCVEEVDVLWRVIKGLYWSSSTGTSYFNPSDTNHFFLEKKQLKYSIISFLFDEYQTVKLY